MSAKRAENSAWETAKQTGIERPELQGVTSGSEAEQLMRETLNEAAATPTPSPELVSDSFAFLDSQEMPESFVHSPRQVRQKPQASQMNIRVSNEARFYIDSYLSELKRAGRPVYMFEVVDALLRELKNPTFRAQVTSMLDNQ